MTTATGPERRIGLLAPSSNTTMEPEIYRALPDGVTLHVARLHLTRISEDNILGVVAELDKEAAKLATADVDIVVLGATAPSFMKGLGYDRTLSERITEKTGKRATTTSTAMLQALRALGVRRLALGSAYDAHVNGVAAKFLEANGLEVVATDCLGLVENLEVGRLPVSTATELGRRVDRAEAEAVLLACTNWKTMDAIDDLERALGKPVITTTQATLWAALRTIGVGDPVPGYGRLLAEDLAPQEAAA